MMAGPNWPGAGPGVNQPGAEGSWGTSREPSFARPRPTMWVLWTAMLGMVKTTGRDPASMGPSRGPATVGFPDARVVGATGCAAGWPVTPGGELGDVV